MTRQRVFFSMIECLARIQMLLGPGSVQTTECHLGTEQDVVNTPNDGIKLRVTP